MLTEADMIRIMAEKYSLAESVAETFVDKEEQNMLNNDEMYELLNYDISVSNTYG